MMMMMVQRRDVVSFNKLILEHARNGHVGKARQVFNGMQSRDVVSGNSMISAYVRIGRVDDARALFNSMPEKSAVSWNAMINAYAKYGQIKNAVTLLRLMKSSSINPNRVTFLGMLDACDDLPTLSEVYGNVIECGFDVNLAIATLLVKAFGKLGFIEESKCVFEQICNRDAISFNAMIDAFAHNGKYSEALELLCRMDSDGIEPNRITLIKLISACSCLSDPEWGSLLYSRVAQSGFESDVFVGTSLIDMYGKCGDLISAKNVFDDLPNRDVASWNAMIGAYAINGQCEATLPLLQRMDKEGVICNSITFINLLDVHISLGEVQTIHAHIARGGFDSDSLVVNALIKTYGKLRQLQNARVVFDTNQQYDEASWASIISAYVKNGKSKEAFELYTQMDCLGVEPSKGVLISMLDACASLGALEQGAIVHTRIDRLGLGSDAIVATALINMYGKCGNLESARKVFDGILNPDMVCSTVMIAMYCRNKQCETGLKLFERLFMEKGSIPDEIAFIAVLDACSTLMDLKQSKKLHAHIACYGFELDTVIATSLVNMYGKCGSLEHARTIFDKIPRKDTFSWNAIISLYAHRGHGKVVLELTEQMRWKFVKPDKFTLIGSLDACATLAALKEGKMIHASLGQAKVDCDIEVVNSLINMYANCGCVEDARRVFNKMPCWDVVSWNSLIAAYSQNGQGEVAVELFRQMAQEGSKPDEITFINLLTACSSAGLLHDGLSFFVTMWRDNGMVPTANHYVCMIDLVGRVGYLDHAEDLLNDLPYEPPFDAHGVAWGSLLSACRSYGDLERGAHAAEYL